MAKSTSIGGLLNSVMREQEQKWKLEDATPDVIFKQTAYSKTKPNYLKTKLAMLNIFTNQDGKEIIMYGSVVGQFDSARFLDKRVKEKLDVIGSQIEKLKKEYQKTMYKEYATLVEVTKEDIKNCKFN